MKESERVSVLDGNSPPDLHSAPASTFELSALRWLWPGRFALGKLGLLVGLPDEGKGQVFSDVASRCTRGSEWPCGEGRAPEGNVLLLTAEDGISDTVKPRLLAAGADLDRIHIIKMVRHKKKDRMFSLVTDLALLRQKIITIGNVVLVLIDPITAYLGHSKIDSFRTTDVRAVLGPVVDLADELGIAFLAIMHFNKKIDINNALLRISDSLAFGATARHVFAVIDDPENKRKLFVKAKNNLASNNIKSLAYGFGTRMVGKDSKTGEEVWAPHIEWFPEPVDVSAFEAMSSAGAPAARDDARHFLTDMLRNGPVLKSDIEDAAEGNGISMRTVERAKAEMKIVARKDGEPEPGSNRHRWRWHLPPTWTPRDKE
jgi:hypothetical protein